MQQAATPGRRTLVDSHAQSTSDPAVEVRFQVGLMQSKLEALHDANQRRTDVEFEDHSPVRTGTERTVVFYDESIKMKPQENNP